MSNPIQYDVTGERGQRVITFAQSDHVVRFLARRAHADCVDGDDAKRVDREGLEAEDLVARSVVARVDAVVGVPVAVLADSVIRQAKKQKRGVITQVSCCTPNDVLRLLMMSVPELPPRQGADLERRPQ